MSDEQQTESVEQTEQTEQAQAWSFPDIDQVSADDVVCSEAVVEPLTSLPNDAHAVNEEARREGYDVGYAEGLAAGKEEGNRQGLEQAQAQAHAELEHYKTELEQLLSAFQKPKTLLTDNVEIELLQLTLAICTKLIGQELTMEPEKIKSIITPALQLLPNTNKSRQLFVHPDDLALLTKLDGFAEGIDLKEEANLHRGEIRIESETGEIDGTFRARFNELLDSIKPIETLLDKSQDPAS